MNRKIKFSLNFKNESVRTIDDFKNHFDLLESVESFKDDRLIRWLYVHDHINHYNKVKEVKSEKDIDIAKDIVDIFEINIDSSFIEDAFKVKGDVIVKEAEIQIKIQEKGTFNYPNGDKYIGELKDGLPNGQGTLNYYNGDKYVGEFKDDKFHGEGTYYYINGNKYVGEFKNSKFNGEGTFYYVDGDKYIGEFKDDKKYGEGNLIVASTGRSYNIFNGN